MRPLSPALRGFIPEQVRLPVALLTLGYSLRYSDLSELERVPFWQVQCWSRRVVRRRDT